MLRAGSARQPSLPPKPSLLAIAVARSPIALFFFSLSTPTPLTCCMLQRLFLQTLLRRTPTSLKPTPYLPPSRRSFTRFAPIMAPTTLAVECTHAELKDGEMKEVAFGDEGKVLLSKVGGEIYATSSKVRPGSARSGSRRPSALTCLPACHLPIAVHALRRSARQGRPHRWRPRRLPLGSSPPSALIRWESSLDR